MSHKIFCLQKRLLRTAIGCLCATWWRTESGTGRTRAKTSVSSRSGTKTSRTKSAKFLSAASNSGFTIAKTTFEMILTILILAHQDGLGQEFQVGRPGLHGREEIHLRNARNLLQTILQQQLTK